MKRPILGLAQSPSARSKDGYIMIITVIIIGAIVSVVLVETALTSITELQDASIYSHGVAARIQAESCMDEALIQVNRDNDYTGETLDLGSGTCDIAITGVDNSRTVSVTGELNDYEHSLSAEVTLDTFSVDEWDN